MLEERNGEVCFEIRISWNYSQAVRSSNERPFLDPNM